MQCSVAAYVCCHFELCNDTDYANLESSLTQFTIIADIYLQIRFFLLIHVYHIESNFKKKVWSNNCNFICTCRYTNIAACKSYTFPLGGLGGGSKCIKQKLIGFFYIYFYVNASIMCICLSACIHVLVGLVHPTPYL